jgi:hypothetical protein
LVGTNEPLGCGSELDPPVHALALPFDWAHGRNAGEVDFDLAGAWRSTFCTNPGVRVAGARA